MLAARENYYLNYLLFTLLIEVLINTGNVGINFKFKLYYIMKQYILTLLLVFLLCLLTKGNNCYYHITFKSFKSEENRKWIQDTIVFEFDLKDSLLSIKTEKEDREFNILSVSFNDYSVENNIKADIYKLSEGYYLWIKKNSYNLNILQVILFDDKERYYIYR